MSTKHKLLLALFATIIVSSMLAIFIKAAELSPTAVAAFAFSIITSGFGITNIVVQWGRDQHSQGTGDEPT